MIQSLQYDNSDDKSCSISQCVHLIEYSIGFRGGTPGYTAARGGLLYHLLRWYSD